MGLFTFISKQKHIIILCRKISTGNLLNGSQNVRFMKKIMMDTKKKKKWNNGSFKMPVLESPSNISEGATEGSRSSNSRRIAVLNKLFMRHITDLMASGECASVFLGRGLEINKVKVTPDFQKVNVFWIAKGSEDDDVLENLLTQHSGNLRHELSQLRVMGNVPRIHFVKDYIISEKTDKEYAKLMEVDLRLAKADFGDDYVPVEPSYRLRSKLHLNTSLPENLKTKIHELENNIDSQDEYEEPLPPMRMDVFGINHSQIMEKVVRSIKKSKALHRKVDAAITLQGELNTNENPTIYTSDIQQKLAFTKFLKRRQILREKAKKGKELYPELSYIYEEKELLDDSKFWNEIKEDEDYIEELEDEPKI